MQGRSVAFAPEDVVLAIEDDDHQALELALTDQAMWDLARHDRTATGKEQARRMISHLGEHRTVNNNQGSSAQLNARAECELNKMVKVMAKCATTGSGSRFGRVARSFWAISRSRGVAPPRRQQSTPQQVQVRQCKRGSEPW